MKMRRPKYLAEVGRGKGDYVYTFKIHPVKRNIKTLTREPTKDYQRNNCCGYQHLFLRASELLFIFTDTLGTRQLGYEHCPFQSTPFVSFLHSATLQ